MWSALFITFGTGISGTRNERIMTNREQVLALIRSEPGLTDRAIRERTGIEPHQQVNQICRTFAAQGLIQRTAGPDGLLINIPANVPVGRDLQSAIRQVPAAIGSPGKGRHSRDVRVEEGRLPRLEFSDTLFVVPCSGWKDRTRMTGASEGFSVLDSLPAQVSDDLRHQRAKNASEARVDKSVLLPAYKRYTGHLYNAADSPAGNAFETLMRAGAEILIISGGYGVVHAREPIGWYNGVFCNADWSNSLISRCLAAYADTSGSKIVIGLFSKSGDYAKAFCKTHWPETVERVCLVTPISPSRSGTQVTVPRATGEALAAIARGELLSTDWTSSDCLPVTVTNLLT